VTELLLGLDIGTASSKAVLATPDGEVVASAVRSHSLLLPRPGWAEHDAEEAWWHDLVALCHELLPGRAARVGAGGLSGVGPCVVPRDAVDTPRRPGLV
jgi:xylulokinase